MTRDDAIQRDPDAEKKTAFLEALATEECFGIEGKALAIAGATRRDLKRWKTNDPDFAQSISDIQETQVDFAENKLFSLINKENPIAIIFFLKTKGKHRGYCEDLGLVQPSAEPVIFRIGDQNIQIE